MFGVFTQLTLLGAVLLCCFSVIQADTPANCTYGEVIGRWIFYENQRSHDRSIDCQKSGDASHKITIELSYPDLAVDQYENAGSWTMIYNQGFEITVAGRKIFAFFAYTENGTEVTSFCDRTLAGSGWSHDVLGRNWACVQGKKITTVPTKTHRRTLTAPSGLFRNNHDLIRQINQQQKMWTAKAYPDMHGLSHDHLLKMRGGLKSRVLSRPKPAPVSKATKFQTQFLPASWDWRNVSGENYVSPVRDQGGCGSCYSFSSMGMLEARLRVMTHNDVQATLSTQEIVSCSAYSQGCEGGFPYLIAGKYAQDYGVVQEECNPYVGQDSACSGKECIRHYVSEYQYVGGYYGACNEDRMKLALVNNGPLSVSFEVYPDFMHYSGGIYHHTGLQDKFNPFELTNHAVLLVGYGTDDVTGLPYWIVKNSWSTKWGESGYFRIRRGTDECGIESIAVEAMPIP